jgi:hypothetical protein
MPSLFIRPAVDPSTGERYFVRDPVSGAPLSADGENKPASTFWLRRLRDRDVEKCRPKRPPTGAAGEAAPAPALPAVEP